MKENQLSGLLITGLLAILGTVTGQALQGYWDTKLAAKEFQSKLILRALEPDDVNERIKSLEFLVDAKLLQDPEVERGLTEIISKGEESIPQFQPENTILPTTGGEGFNPSVKPQGLEGITPLVALKVRHGDVIDAVTPIFAELGSDISIQNTIEGNRFGGGGGGETILEHDGYIITGFNVSYGYYFGAEQMVHIQVIWNKLTSSGIDPQDKITSDLLGSGNYADITRSEQIRADPGNYIDDFSILVITHTDGTTFLSDINIIQEPLSIRQ